jgi:hypothetical protein
MTAAGAELSHTLAQAPPSAGNVWIFSPGVDAFAFVTPAAIALLLTALAPALGLASESPEWLWIGAVLCVDVAHVWSTLFVSYLDPHELRAHPARYALVPTLGWVAGVALYSSAGPLGFWRALAYVAVFHFVRQQYGWLALYRARSGEKGRYGAVIDACAIYAATLYPLLFWHAHLPRDFAWFMPGDFWQGLPLAVVDIARALYVLALAAYAGRALYHRWRNAPVPWGKHLLVATTAATWYAGIVGSNSDTTFTLCNVLAHGIPYAVLVFVYRRHALAQGGGTRAFLLGGSLAGAALRFVACLWLLAFLEELLWDRGVWHERPELFGGAWELGSLETLLVPLLAVPQLTHYLLDGFLWRRGQNPALATWAKRSR